MAARTETYVRVVIRQRKLHETALRKSPRFRGKLRTSRRTGERRAGHAHFKGHKHQATSGQASAIGRLSRPGARYPDYSWPVSPDRSPNPACPLLSTGLSTVPAASGVVEDPGTGNLAATVAIPGNRHRLQVEQLDPARRDRLPPPLGSGDGPADVLPPPAV